MFLFHLFCLFLWQISYIFINLICSPFDIFDEEIILDREVWTYIYKLFFVYQYILHCLDLSYLYSISANLSIWVILWIQNMSIIYGNISFPFILLPALFIVFLIIRYFLSCTVKHLEYFLCYSFDLGLYYNQISISCRNIGCSASSNIIVCI